MEKYKDSDGKSLLNVYKADLMVDDSFDLAFEGCDYVIHVASPVKLTSSDPINEIITPAIEGIIYKIDSINHNISKFPF